MSRLPVQHLVVNSLYTHLDSQESLLNDSERIYNSKPYRTSWTHVHISFILLYSLFFGLSFYRQSKWNDHGPNMIHSPARNALHHERQLFEDDLTALNQYRGAPRRELDEAWHNLVQYSNIGVSASDLLKINRTSVKLSDGSGLYMAELNVHHQLHCLKMIRQSYHPEHYSLPPRHMAQHIDHCLDNLRQLVMCKADISLQTYDWLDNNPRPFANFEIEHECYNWDAVNDWAKEHSFDLYDNRTLVHPTLGPSFPVDSHGAMILTEDPDPLNGMIITPPVE